MSDEPKQEERLRKAIERDNTRMDHEETRKSSLFGFLLYGGTLGILLILPILAGAYLGSWIDSRMSGYSVGWTVGLILLGIIFGIWNVYQYLKEHYDQAD